MLTVARETSVARPAVFATRPAIAAPKAIPSDWRVGMDDAVRILSPGHAAVMLQLLMCAKQRPMPAPISATPTLRRDNGPWAIDAASPTPPPTMTSGPSTITTRTQRSSKLALYRAVMVQARERRAVM